MHKLSLALKAGYAMLSVALIHYLWFSDRAGIHKDNVFINAALLMFIGLVFLSDALIVEDAPRAAAKLVGYAGLSGLGLSAFVF